jgi:Transposase
VEEYVPATIASAGHSRTLLEKKFMYFDKAYIVGDPFHVVRELLRCYNSLLEPFEERMLAEYIDGINAGFLVRPIRAKRKKKKLTYKETKNEKEKEVKTPTFAEIRVLLRTKKQKLITAAQKDAVKFLIDLFPEVRAGYAYVQGVMALYHEKVSSAKASEALDGLERDLLNTGMPPEVTECFLKFRNLCRRCRNEICAFWACGWTNSEVESQNNVIKDIDRRGHGLTFQELRRRWLYGQSTSEILGRTQPIMDKKKTGPRKKEIRELRTLPLPEPVRPVNLGGQGWLFEPPSQTDESLEK